MECKTIYFIVECDIISTYLFFIYILFFCTFDIVLILQFCIIDYLDLYISKYIRVNRTFWGAQVGVEKIGFDPSKQNLHCF
jgi:hypothetical protein